MAGGLRVAVIGAGYFSQFHVEAWCNMGAVAEVYLCDSDCARARALGDRFGLTDIHTDAAGMLARIDADLLDIVTPPATQLDLVRLGCRHGLPMVCQKALAATFLVVILITYIPALPMALVWLLR